jgi:hypothetical protein
MLSKKKIYIYRREGLYPNRYLVTTWRLFGLIPVYRTEEEC